MSDLIDRQAAIDTLFELYEYQREIDPTEGADLVRQGVFLAEKRIENLPSAQPEIAKRIVGKSRDGMTLWYQCDTCNEPVDVQDNFCRGCGRRLIDG